MLRLLKSDQLKYPLFSEINQTYVSPILGNRTEYENCYNLAHGWRYFKYLKVIQKISGKLFLKVMTFDEFLMEAKKSSFNCKNLAESIANNLTKKRNCTVGLNFSKLNVMGVINITPDSFYNKSRVTNIKNFKIQINKMEKLGVDIIDIGAESSKPGSISVPIKEELNRLEVYLKELGHMKLKAITSVDSRNQETMKKSLKYGISVLNDISAFSTKKSQDILFKNNVCGVIMHMQKVPKIMQHNPKYFFPPIDIYNFFEKKINYLLSLGIKSSQIIIDPGFGFGKSLNHNLILLNYLPMFHALGVPIAVGLSRKSLIEEISTKNFKSFNEKNNLFSPEKRLGGSIALALKAYDYGAQIIRTHDPFETLQSIYCVEEVDISHKKV